MKGDSVINNDNAGSNFSALVSYSNPEKSLAT